jgi:hypothetical protein
VIAVEACEVNNICSGNFGNFGNVSATSDEPMPRRHSSC